MVRHYCIGPPPQNKNEDILAWPPFELFQLFYAYHYIYISVSPSFNYIINVMDLKMNFEASTHYWDPAYDSSSSSDFVIDTSSSSSSSSSSSWS